MSLHLNPLDILLESQQPDNPPPDFRWGWVDGLAPNLSVRLDRDPTTVIRSCCSLSYPLEAGDRVMVMVYDGRAVVFGRGGGDRPSAQWQSFVPEMISTGTNPSWGNSTRVGRFIHRQDNSVQFTAKFTIGTNFSPGSGFYSFVLPVPAYVDNGVEWIINVHITSQSATESGGGLAEAWGDGRIETAGLVDRMYFRRNNTSPLPVRVDANRVWSAGDRIFLSGSYEAA